MIYGRVLGCFCAALVFGGCTAADDTDAESENSGETSDALTRGNLVKNGSFEVNTFSTNVFWTDAMNVGVWNLFSGGGIAERRELVAGHGYSLLLRGGPTRRASAAQIFPARDEHEYDITFYANVTGRCTDGRKVQQLLRVDFLDANKQIIGRTGYWLNVTPGQPQQTHTVFSPFDSPQTTKYMQIAIIAPPSPATCPAPIDGVYDDFKVLDRGFYYI